jgi:MoxR-like ATPase
MGLARPFLVIATQNPIELEGTFPLPEAQIDRFLLRISMGYPNEEEEHRILARFERLDPFDTLKAVVDVEDLLALQSQVRTVRVERSVTDYIVNLCRGTRNATGAQIGISPRGTMALYRAAQAFAAIHARDYVLPDDVKTLAPYALAHRIVVDGQSRLRGRKAEDILRDVLERTPVPVDTI